MKIALVTATFLPYRSGTAQVVYQTAQQLHQNGHEVVVFTPLVQNLVSSQPRFDFAVLYQKPVFSMGNAALTPSLLQDLRGFDLIHLHYPFIFGAELVVLAARRHHTPLVVTYHQTLSAKDHRKPLFWLYNRLIQPWILQQARAICVTSFEYALNPAAKLLPFKNKLIELPNGVDTELFVPQDPLPTDPNRYLLFVGTMDSAHHFKGVDVLLEALVQLPEIQAIFVGDGNLRADYERLAQPCGARVRFVGQVDTPHLVQLYQQAWVTVLPSTDTGEAFGVVLLESMSCGTPVIASALPGVSSVVNSTKGGFLVPANNVNALCKTIHKIWNDKKQRDRLGQLARNNVKQRYDLQVIQTRLESTYSALR